LPDDVKTVLLNEASRACRRDITEHDELKDLFNINKVLSFIKGVHGRLGVELDVNSFYVWNTVASLAAAIETGSHRDVPKLLQLRDGDPHRPLIVYAGGVSCFLEIKSVLDALDYDGAIYGVCLTRFDRPITRPATVEDEVSACHEALKRHGLGREICLLGYSFGGVFALELARLLEEQGGSVRFLGLIDTQQSEHTWPFPIWLKVVTRRIRRRAGRFASELFASRKFEENEVSDHQTGMRKPWSQKLRPILFRYWKPTWESYPQMAPEWVEGHTPDYQQAGCQLLRMRGVYRPRRYERPVVYYRAVGGSLNLCDPRQIWQPYLPNVEWVDVRGTHLSVIFGRNGEAIGRDLGRRLKARQPEPV
jgi:thioesterase domain-containing protein